MANPATTLARTSQDERIPGLPVLPPGTDPATLTVPVYNPATDLTHQAPIGGPATNSNAVVGAPKLVRYRDSRLYGVPAGALTLDRLLPATIVPGTVATVDNPSNTPLATVEAPKQYVATLVAVGTAGAVLVPRYIGAAAGDTVPITWQEVVATSGEAAKSFVATTLVKAQALLAAATIPADTFGACYAITAPDWNATNTPSTVYVEALTASAFASTGWVAISGMMQLVQVDVATGTWQVLLTSAQRARLAPVWVNDAYGKFTGFQSLAAAAAANATTGKLQSAVVTLNEAQQLTAQAVTDIGTATFTLRGNGQLLYAQVGQAGSAKLALPAQQASDIGLAGLTVAGDFFRAQVSICDVASGQEARVTAGSWHFTGGIIAGTLYLGPGTTTSGTPILGGAGKIVDERGLTAADLAMVATTLPLASAHTAAYTLQLSDMGAVVPAAGSAPVVFTVPAGLGNPAPASGATGAAKVCYPLQLGTGQLSLVAAANVNLLTAGAGGLRATGPGGRLILIWLDANTVLVEGGI